MKKKLEKIYEDHIVHHSFLDKKTVLECMNKAYYLGKNEEKEKHEKVKKSLETLLENWKQNSLPHE
mgnify:CR=1 FL=1